jgi:uncharacterized protein YjbJ (UPF0337 family)
MAALSHRCTLELQSGALNRLKKEFEAMPNQDEMKGKFREGTGATQQKAGEVTGDRDMETKGAATKNEGKLEGAWGKVKGAAENAADAVKDKIHH